MVKSNLTSEHLIETVVEVIIVIIILCVVFVGCAPTTSPKGYADLRTDGAVNEDRLKVEVLPKFEGTLCPYLIELDGVRYLIVERIGGGVAVIRHKPLVEVQGEFQIPQKEMD